MKSNSNLSVVGIFSAVLASGLSACSPMASTKFSEAQVAQALVTPTKYTRPACEVNRADYQINADVVSFEMKSNFGVRFGFQIPASWGVKASFGIKSAALAVSMQAMDPLNLGYPISSVVNSNNQNSFNMDVNATFAMFNVGATYDYNTPLAKLTMGSMNLGLTSLYNDLLKRDPRIWEAHVLQVLSPTQVIVNSGSESGIQLGDQFDVYNVTTQWSDPAAPCTSHFIMETPNTTKPIGTLTATQVSPSRTALQVNAELSEAIQQGAIIVVSKLNTVAANNKSVKRAALKKQISVGNLGTQPITFNNSVDGTSVQVSLDTFFNHQIDSAIQASEFALFDPN